MPLKTLEEISLIRQASEILSRTHGHIAGYIKPGVTTQKLDKIADSYITKAGATPSFKGYQGYPATLCISINQQVVHGIPDTYVLKQGDIVSIDCAVFYKGYHSDAAYTYALGNIDKKILNLLSITKESLYQGIEQATLGNSIGDIGYAIDNYVTKNGYTVVKEYGGHGVGKTLHEPPHIANFGKKGEGVKIKEGMVLAIEPMVNLGKAEIIHKSGKWSVCTLDNKPSAHFEHTIAIINGVPETLTSYKYIEQAFQQYV